MNLKADLAFLIKFLQELATVSIENVFRQKLDGWAEALVAILLRLGPSAENVLDREFSGEGLGNRPLHVGNRLQLCLRHFEASQLGGSELLKLKLRVWEVRELDVVLSRDEWMPQRLERSQSFPWVHLKDLPNEVDKLVDLVPDGVVVGQGPLQL